MLGELGNEVQRIEHLHILLEILGIGGVEKHPRLERLVPDFLQRKRRYGLQDTVPSTREIC